MVKVKTAESKSNGSPLDFEAQLWAAADKMRGHMDASECKHVCLGLIFLKYISDAFEEKREQLLFGFSNPKSEWFIKNEPQRADAADVRYFSLSASVAERAGVRCRLPSVPPEARWHRIKAKAKSPEIGKVIDDAMGAIERENPTLKGVLPRDYARPSLDKVRLGGLVDIISNIGFNESTAKSKDVLGRVYEYEKFASAEGTLQSAKTIYSNRRMKWGFSLSASNGGEGRGEVSKFANEPSRNPERSWAKVAVRKHFVRHVRVLGKIRETLRATVEMGFGQRASAHSILTHNDYWKHSQPN